MAFRKFAADKIFDGYRFIEGQVLITDEYGRVLDLVDRQEAGDDVQDLDGILTTGLVNCHCHLELSHMKGSIPEKTGLVDFVLKIVTQRHHSEASIQEAIAEAEQEMWQNGIVAVGDICNNVLSLEQKKENKLAYHNFIELSGWDPSVAEQRLQRGLDLCKRFSELSQPCSLAPHAPYSVSEQLWKLMQPVMEGRLVSMHNQESAEENILFEKGTGDFLRLFQALGLHTPPFVQGRSSLQSVIDYLKPAERIMLVHNSFTSETDLEFLERNRAEDIIICLCPNANLYIEDCLPPVNLFRQHSFSIVLGTDSLASNHKLDILSEIHAIRKAYPEISMEECLRWATINGARALGMESRLGSFEKNKVPGVIRIKEDKKSIERLI